MISLTTGGHKNNILIETEFPWEDGSIRVIQLEVCRDLKPFKVR